MNSFNLQTESNPSLLVGPVKISVLIISAYPLYFLGYMSNTPHGCAVVNELWAKKSLRWRSCQPHIFFLCAFPSELQACQFLLRKRVLSQTSAELCAQCAACSANHESKPIPRSPWLCTPRLTESSVPEDALWTDESQAATSMRSHLKLAIDKYSTDLLFISFHNILLFPVP